MIAGGPNHPIWFTNLIYDNTLYTLTYKWPNIPLNSLDCSSLGFFNRHLLNQTLKTSHFVGREILRKKPRRYVNHWRLAIAAGPPEPGNVLRFPIAEGDFYVDQNNRGRFWQVLHFGFQNLFDPDLDEWIRMKTFKLRPGNVELPDRCPLPTP